MSVVIPTIRDGDWVSVRKAIYRLSSGLGIGPGSSPTYAGLTISGLTASRLVYTDASKALTSVTDLTSWIAGTTNQITVTDDSDGTVTLTTPQDIHTGASPTFVDLTLSAPSSIYSLSHDSFADFVAAEHVSLPNTIANVLSDHDLAAHTALGLFDASADVDHDQTTNFVANEHIDHTAVTISAGTGLTGGGDISANRSISLSHLGIESLTDPNANKLMLWDDTDNAVKFIIVGNNLSYDHATYTLSASGGADTYKVKVDAAATEDYIGAASNDGVLRTGTGLSYTDGGDFVTLALSVANAMDSLTNTYNISADTTWEYVSDAGPDYVSVTLPAAGTYLLLAQSSGYISFSAGSNECIYIRLYNETDAAEVPNSAVTVVQGNSTGTPYQATATLFTVYTVAASKEIRLQAYRTAATWTGAQLFGAVTRLAYLRIV